MIPSPLMPSKQQGYPLIRTIAAGICYIYHASFQQGFYCLAALQKLISRKASIQSQFIVIVFLDNVQSVFNPLKLVL